MTIKILINKKEKKKKRRDIRKALEGTPLGKGVPLGKKVPLSKGARGNTLDKKTKSIISRGIVFSNK